MNIQITGDYNCPPVQQGHISILKIKQQPPTLDHKEMNAGKYPGVVIAWQIC